MALTLEQILAPITVAEARQFMIDVLTSLGFTGAASWQPGSLARTLGIEIPAELMANVRAIMVTYGNGGYNDLAEGDWLTLLSKSQFDNTRLQAVATQGVVELASADAMSIEAGELLVADHEEGRTFRNIGPVVLAAGSEHVPCPVQAEVAGIDGNVGIGTITIVQTSHAGVTVTNPGIGGAWVTRSGANEEDDEELRQRNRTKWATRAYATPAAGYENYAREADPSVKRVFVDDQNPAGPGSVRIYIADEEGPCEDDAANAVEDYINGAPPPAGDGICRRPLCSFVDCEPAVAFPMAVTCTVYAALGYGDLEGTVKKAIEDHFSTIPIGGTKDWRGPDDGHVLISGLYTAVMQVPGVVNVVFSAPPVPPGDVALEPNEVAMPTAVVTVAPVS